MTNIMLFNLNLLYAGYILTVVVNLPLIIAMQAEL